MHQMGIHCESYLCNSIGFDKQPVMSLKFITMNKLKFTLLKYPSKSQQ